MSLFICSLNSGSNGNCYYVGNHNEAILVDAGISCRETEKRFINQGLDIGKVKAIFISHEHIDHISGLKTLSKKFQLPVYITTQTLANSNLKLDETLIKNFNSNDSIEIGNLTITALSKKHDAAHPHSFTISENNHTVGVFTDIGTACKDVIHHFKKCTAAFLETNYDDEMLDNGNYPQHLKKRIKSDHGHLSNNQALELFKKHKPSYMSHLLLSHLSKENNNPELVKYLFEKYAGKVQIIVASRYEETAVFQINNELISKTKVKEIITKAEQLSLF